MALGTGLDKPKGIAKFLWPEVSDEVASWKNPLTELHACSLLSRFGFALNAPVPLRCLSSQALHVMGIINAVVLAK